MMKQQTKQIWIAACFACAVMTHLSACSSLIVIHDQPLSGTGETTDTAYAESTADAVTETDTQTAAGPETESEQIPAPADPEETAEKALSALRDADMDGMNYLIAAADSAAAFGDGFSGDEAGSTVLPETRVKRTRMVEEKYNVRILTFSYETEELYREIKEAYLSDTQYFADFYALPSSQLGRYQAAGLIFNLRSLPFTDFSASYFNKQAMNAMSAGYGIYAAAGDYTFSPENYHAVYFNKTLNEKSELPSPYTLVENGGWTWDVLLSTAAAARTLTDRDGNQVYFGHNLSSFDTNTGEAMVIASSGTHMVSTGLDRTPSLSADTDLLTDLVSVVKNAFVSAAAAPTKNQYTDTYPTAEDMFAGGKMLYYVGGLSRIRKWADIDTVWGLLPLPKADTSQKSYYTYAGDSAVICVPSTVGAPESSGMILQALFAASAGTYPDVYLNEALSYYVRDGKTVDMLELICNSVYYDFASMFAAGYNYLNYATIYGFHAAVTQGYSVSSMYQNYRTSAASELQKAFGVG